MIKHGQRQKEDRNPHPYDEFGVLTRTAYTSSSCKVWGAIPVAQFLTELRRRKVYHVAAVYGVVAWLLAQAGGLLFQTYDAPAWMQPVFIGLLMLGFPIALLLAWAYQILPDSVARDTDEADVAIASPLTGSSFIYLISSLLFIAISWIIYREVSGDIIRVPEVAPLESVAAPAHAIAVLPLENLSNQPDDDWFAAGMHDALIADLSKVSGLAVTSRTSALTYRDTIKRSPEIGQELRVSTLVEGTVIRVGGQVRISVQLIDAASDSHIWAGTYDREMEDVLKLQSEIARAIAQEIEVELTPAEERRLTTVRQINPDTYEAYLLGMYHVQQLSPEGKALGLGYLKEAVARDPSDALAWAGIALAWNEIGHGSVAQADAFPQARAAALRAIELDDNLAEAHAALAESRLYYEWDWEGARQSFERALDLNPSLAVAHAHFAWYFDLMGDSERAIAEELRAHNLDPRNSVWASWVGWLYSGQGNLEEGLEWAERSIAIYPDQPVVQYFLGLISTANGQHDRAILAHQRAGELNANWGAGLAHALASAGHADEARELLIGLTEAASPDTLTLAMAYIALGDHDKAFYWLEKSLEIRRDWTPWIGRLYEYRPLYADPRMADLLGRMNLEF